MNSIYQQITNVILEALKNGEAKKVPWRKPWSGSWIPRNGLTKRPYNGINSLYLSCVADIHGYDSNDWFTYNAAKMSGGHVRRGEKSKAVVVYYGQAEKQTGELDPQTGLEVVATYPVIKFYYVFNRDQTENVPEEQNFILPEDERLQICEDFLQFTDAVIEEDKERACYIPSRDVIQMPSFGSFESQGAYYSVAFHELVHWSGHESRVNRDLSSKFERANYAAEELIAEFGSAYLGAFFQLEGDLQHPEYIQSWIRMLTEDDKAVFKATSEARKATDWLLKKTGHYVEFNNEDVNSAEEGKMIHD